MIPIKETTASAIANSVSNSIDALIATVKKGKWNSEQVILALNEIAIQVRELADAAKKNGR